MIENTLEVDIIQLKLNALTFDIIDTIEHIENLQKRLETKLKILKKIRKNYEKSIYNMDCENNMPISLAPIHKPTKNERNTDKKPKTKKSTSSNGS